MKIWVHFNGQQQGPYEFDQLKGLPITPQTPVWYEGLAQWTVAGVAPATAILFQPDSETPTVPPQPQSAAPQPQSAAPQPQSAAPQPQSAAPQPQSASPQAQWPQSRWQQQPQQPQWQQPQQPQQPQWPHQPQWQQPQPQWQQPQPQWQQPQPQWQAQPQPQQQPQPQLTRPATYIVWSVLLMIFCCSPFALAGLIFGVLSSSRYDAGDYGGAKSMSTAAAWMLIISIATAIFSVPFGFGLFTGCV